MKNITALIAAILVTAFGWQVKAQVGIFSPGMTISPYLTVNSPANEEVQNVIDGTSAKFLDFDDINNDGIGFTVDLGGVAQIAKSIEITTANDFPDRDAQNYEIFGSNNGTNFTSIATGTIPCVTTRHYSRIYNFTNTTAYSHYRINLTARCGGGNGIYQVEEVQLYDAQFCIAPMALAVSNITSTTLDFGWTEPNTATEWQVDYGAIGFTPGSATAALTTSNPYSASIVQGNEYDFYVRSICAVGDTSAWAGPFSYKYCDVSSQYTSEYLSVANSSGALVDFNYTSNSFPAGSYADETAQQFEAFETQSFDVNTTYSAGSNGVSIYVDWNNNTVFEPSELMSTISASQASLVSSVTVPAGTPQGDYRMRIRGQWGSSSNPPACGQITWGSTIDLNLTIVAPPSCLPPNLLTSSSITDSSIDFGWTENGTATTWNVEYGPTGFTPGTGTMVNGVTTNPFTVTGLSSNTEYDFYVQADCGGGDLSYWSSVLGPILTECTSFIANGFCEGFDANSSSTLNCWRIKDENNDGDTWQVGTLQPNTGPMSAQINTDFNNGANDDYLISPQMNLTGIEAMKFAYSVYSNGEPNDFQVLLSTTGTNISDFTDTLMALAQYTNTDFQDTVIDLTAYTGPVYVAFHVPPGGLDGWYLFIDDVCFGECIPTPGVDGAVDVCLLDGTIDLSDNIVSHNNSYGRWEFPANQNLIVDDTLFNVSTMAEGSHEVLYIVEGLCQPDTTIATINVYGPSSAGNDGLLEVCKNEPINLFSGLSGNVDLSGQWFDFSGTLLPNSQPNAQSVPGQYNYTYIANNGFCPADTSIVNVTVDGTCDFLAIGTEEFTDISVFPNPSTGVLNITNPSNATSLKVEMLDMNGRVVLVENKALNNATEAQLAIDHLERGIYTLRVYNNAGQKTFKIVKQ